MIYEHYDCVMCLISIMINLKTVNTYLHYMNFKVEKSFKIGNLHQKYMQTIQNCKYGKGNL
jgi:hypothetical protein